MASESEGGKSGSGSVEDATAAIREATSRLADQQIGAPSDGENAPPPAATVPAQLLLVVDAAFAVADQLFDALLLYQYWKGGDVAYFAVGLATVALPVIICACIRGMSRYVFSDTLCGQCCLCCSYEADRWITRLVQLVPGLNIAALATASIVDGCCSGFENDEILYTYKTTRAFEAFFEAAPQALFQVYVALKRPEGVNIYVLLVSLSLSLFSVTKTVVAFFLFEDLRGASINRNIFPNFQSKALLFALSIVYELAEIVSRVFSVSLLGYFCGGFSIAAALGAEYILLAIYMWYRQCTHYDWVDYRRFLLLPLTSLAAGDAMSVRVFVLLRLLILGSYVGVAVAVHRAYQVEEWSRLSEIFSWCVAGSTGTWVVLAPAFVNSCNNLNVGYFFWGYTERNVPARLTKCRYPMEINESSGGKTCVCCCLSGGGRANVTRDGAEIAVGVAEVAADNTA